MARLKNGSLPMVDMDTALCRSVGPGDCATDLETGMGPIPDQTCLANATRLPHFVMLGQSLEATLFSLDGARHDVGLRLEEQLLRDVVVARVADAARADPARVRHPSDQAAHAAAALAAADGLVAGERREEHAVPSQHVRDGAQAGHAGAV